MEGADQSVFAPAAADAQPEAAAAEPLPAGVLCYQCQYDLAGLDAGGVCPECGLAIAASWPRSGASGEARRRAQRARGRIRLVLATTIMLLVLHASLVLAACGAVVNAVGQHAQGTFEDGEGAIVAGTLLALLAGLAYAVLATVLAAMPGFHGERKRFGVRVGGPMLVAGLVAVVLAVTLNAPFVFFGGAITVVVGNVLCVIAILGICGDALARVDRARPRRWLVVALAAVFAVLPVVAAVAAHGSVAGACVALGAVLIMAGASAVLAWQAIRGVRAVEFEIGQPGQPAGG
ncbi:hypothetical protein AY599_00025 [Leptolyngbya valderiana BDU 20041]|nr:hypothetical protein AY599_00025 [Leptolyngbya valderiana BDU 20041]